MSGLSKQAVSEKQYVKEFLELDKKLPQDIDEMRVNNLNALSEALLAVVDLRITPDVADYISREQAILCWRIVETLRRKKFNLQQTKIPHRCIGGPLDGQYVVGDRGGFVVINNPDEYSHVRVQYRLSINSDFEYVWVVK